MSSVETITRVGRNGKPETTCRFRLHPKTPALELLAQHLGIVGRHAENVNLVALLDAHTIASWPDEKVATALEIVRQAKALVRPTAPLLPPAGACTEPSRTTPIANGTQENAGPACDDIEA